MTTETNSLLPVEVQEGIIIDPADKFDPKKHKSHLINCEKQRLNWERKKKKLFKQREGVSSITDEVRCIPEES